MTSSAPRPDAVRIAVFARAPVPGEVKTRLAPLLGADGAAALHAGLVRHALSAAVQSRVGPVELWCAPGEDHPFFARCAQDLGVTLHRQEGGDLGARMRHAFAHSHTNGAALLLTGSDCPSLDAAALKDAARELASHDAVIAPAEDGGYVLVGLAVDVPGLFEDIAWGGSTVMNATRACLARAGIRWKELPTYWDIDRPADYARLHDAGMLREVLS